MKISIIVPVLNEAAGVPKLMETLVPLSRQGTEVLVVDGGSSDGTPAMAACFGVRVIHADQGRARQMNAGASEASGEVLLFLHADCQLPEGALQMICTALRKKPCWGRFDVRISGRPFMLRVVSWLMNWRSRLTGIATGDQAMFVLRNAFEAVGGFPDQPLMEDIALSKRLKGISPPACIARKVTVSGRRWESRGVWRTIILMWRLRWAYWRGASVTRLAEAYR